MGTPLLGHSGIPFTVIDGTPTASLVHLGPESALSEICSASRPTTSPLQRYPNRSIAYQIRYTDIMAGGRRNLDAKRCSPPDYGEGILDSGEAHRMNCLVCELLTSR